MCLRHSSAGVENNTAGSRTDLIVTFELSKTEKLHPCKTIAGVQVQTHALDKYGPVMLTRYSKQHGETSPARRVGKL